MARATISPLPPAIREEMHGVTWRPDPGCPRLDDLVLLEPPFIDFDDNHHVGEMVVAAEVAPAIARVFARLYAAKFPIARVDRLARFDGDDHASMAANNSSCFNFRCIDGSDRLSLHALGLAVDINPIQNPWVRGDLVLPPEGRQYLNRLEDRPGLIRRPGIVVDAFDAEGWYWGGDWQETKDYHHFAARPR